MGAVSLSDGLPESTASGLHGPREFDTALANTRAHPVFVRCLGPRCALLSPAHVSSRGLLCDLSLEHFFFLPQR